MILLTGRRCGGPFVAAHTLRESVGDRCCSSGSLASAPPGVRLPKIKPSGHVTVMQTPHIRAGLVQAHSRVGQVSSTASALARFRT